MKIAGQDAWLLMMMAAMLSTAMASGAPLVRVGSKLDSESVTLGEMACQLARSTGAEVQFRKQLGGTPYVWQALIGRQIDLYPEYTGTIVQQILPGTEDDEEAIRRALAARGIGMTHPLGFDNTYAIGMREDQAARIGIRTISDLRAHPELRLRFSNEFFSRADGWPGVRAKYELPQQDVGGMEHALSYAALADGSIAATDLYSTDAQIARLHLRVLNDDLRFFPRYQAVFLYRLELDRSALALVAALRRLEGRISRADMIALNYRAQIDRVPNAQVSAQFLRETLALAVTIRTPSVVSQIVQRTVEHLWLVSVSLLGAIVLGLPLGILAAKSRIAGKIILAAVAVLFTIPSLALLVFLIPLFGIGTKPAIFALFLYSLLPIVRNTHAGLVDIAPPLRESAEAMGLPAWARLWRIELPLAAGSILAGIKTAAVINVGTATLGGLIGAGGYGQPIFNGIYFNDRALVLQGAIPAALMALAAQGLFELVERRFVPRGLRQRDLSL